MAPLNPEAPEFYPTHNNTFKIQHQEQPFPLPNYPTSTFTPYSHYYYALSSFPSPALHPYNYFYYPTTTLPPPSFPSHYGAITTPFEPPRVHAIERDSFPVDAHAMNNGRVTTNPDEQCFKGYPKKKRCHPVLPVMVERNETTVMIRNIPSQYTRDMLVEFLDNHCMKVNLRDKECDKEKGEESSSLAFDFVYLPIDFKTGMNKGYAFVNFTKPQAAWKFHLTASDMKWDLFESYKIPEVVSARLQGKERLMKLFETMNFLYETEDVLPVCFNPPHDGVTKAKQQTCGKLLKHQQI